MKSYTPYENVPVAVLEGGDETRLPVTAVLMGLPPARSPPRNSRRSTTSMNDTRVLYVEPLDGSSAVRRRGRGG